MARYSWAKAFMTETMTVKVALPFKDGGSAIADATVDTGAAVITDRPARMVGQLVSVARATGILTYVADITAAASVVFTTHDLYMVAERIQVGNQDFVGYPITNKSDLNHLEARVTEDDLLSQVTTTIGSSRRN